MGLLGVGWWGGGERRGGGGGGLTLLQANVQPIRLETYSYICTHTKVISHWTGYCHSSMCCHWIVGCC